jgi:hypothetical protein
LSKALVASVAVAIPVSIAVGWRGRRRGSRIPTKLEIADVVHIERIHMIADCHANVTGVTA